jgi:hypothetical protein
MNKLEGKKTTIHRYLVTPTKMALGEGTFCTTELSIMKIQHNDIRNNDIQLMTDMVSIISNN